MRRAAAAGVLLTLALRPDPGAAHAFQEGGGVYDRFVEGVSVALSAPSVILCLLPMGVLIGLWRRDGLPAVWPWFLGGQAAGLFAAAAVPPTVALASLGAGAVTGALAALRPDPPAPAPHVLAALTGLLSAAASFQGHGLFALSPGIHAGLLLGANLALAAAAGLAAATLQRWPRPWLTIGWRIAASWLAAVALLVLAFELRPFLT
ncbi:hypothetical protein P1J78_19670 [Psychromarinibacter sp. C21-152]|uniref:HupE / UreJ protein n=1 Tax=Psychromarinibacter sediminicola TaxID=3033385 RepID=A0AAE3NSZ0_9RHOB|nr:hypothetical protein [Psychromarinibacter sediminicola]MDF0602968.1 hypothetical protein [Psychromarinibacter sediminicola]